MENIQNLPVSSVRAIKLGDVAGFIGGVLP